MHLLHASTTSIKLISHRHVNIIYHCNCESPSVHSSRYRTDLQPRRVLREKQKQLVSHMMQVSGQIRDMAAADPWKLLQRSLEYAFFLNGLAQVRPLVHLRQSQIRSCLSYWYRPGMHAVRFYCLSLSDVSRLSAG